MIVIPNRVRVVVVVSALALAAGLLTLALLAKPTQAQAETITSTERLPLNNTYFNPCTGEEFHIEGTVHLVQHRTIDENGTDHVQVHSNTQGRGQLLPKYGRGEVHAQAGDGVCLGGGTGTLDGDRGVRRRPAHPV